MLGKSPPLLLSFISSGFGCAVLLGEIQREDCVSNYDSVKCVVKKKTCQGSFILIHFFHVDLKAFPLFQTFAFVRNMKQLVTFGFTLAGNLS